MRKAGFGYNPFMRRNTLLLGLLLLTAAFSAAAQDNPQMNENELTRNGAQEVVDLHQFFQDWFNGTLPDTADAFERFSGVMAPSFSMVTPAGNTVAIESLNTGLRSAHDRWKQAPGKIWVKNVRTVYTEGELVLISYEEWQEANGETKVRQSTVLFRAKPGLPNDVEWLHVHETWMPED